MIYVKLKDRHVSENLSFIFKEREKYNISKVIEFWKNRERRKRRHLCSTKFYISFYGGIV